jgi:hypothetical protein
MRNIAVAFLLALTSLVVDAQIYKSDKPVVCSSLKNVIEYVSSEYDEIPFWRGSDETSKYILMVNNKTSTWTMIQYNNDLACVVGVGENAKLINLGKII